MRFLKLLKLMAPVGLAVVALSVNPDTSNGQFPQGGGKGERGGRGDRGDRGAPPSSGGVQFQFPAQGGSERGGERGDRGGRGGFGGMPQGGSSGFGGMSQGGSSGFGGMPQGGGFGGRGGFDPSMMADSSFSRLQASYGGSGDSLDYSKIPAATREQTNAMSQRFGGEPMPASGSISKDQYRAQFAERMQAMRGGGRSMTPTAPGAIPGATTASVSFETPGAAAPGTVPGQQPWGGQQQWGQSRGPGGTDPGQITDQQLQEYMRRYDKDNDGKISAAEAAGSDRLRGVFQQYDKNADGFIDMAEYRVYVTDRFSGGGQQGGSSSMSFGQQPGGWGQPGGVGPEGMNRVPQEEAKPVVLRYGKLPKELPSWFNTMDTNTDGQIALYEWRNEGRAMADFVPMDLNGDGLVTAEEYLRFKNPNASVAAVSGGTSREGGFGREGGGPRGGNAGENPRGGFSFGRGTESRSESSPSKDEKKDRKDEKRPSGGGNPFNRGR